MAIRCRRIALGIRWHGGPVIVDREGNFYGRFSANKLLRQRTMIPAFVTFLDALGDAGSPDLNLAQRFFCGGR